MPALVAAVLCAGCSVTGEPTAAADRSDLTPRSLAPADLPSGQGSRVPAPAVPAVLADLAGLPSSGSLDPADCLPPEPIADGAAVVTEVAAGGTSNYTAAITHVDQPLADTVERAEQCPETETGPSRGTAVTTEVLPAPPAPDGVESAAIRRTARSTGATTAPIDISTLSLFAQRDDVRVQVEYRWQSDGPPPAQAAAALDELYRKAVATAFG